MFICNSRDKKNDKHMLTILAKNKCYSKLLYCCVSNLKS